jgi:hypothetical protein
MKTMRFRLLSLCLFTFAFALVSGESRLDAQGTPAASAPWQAAPFSASAKDVLDAAAAITPQQYATVTILNEEHRIVLDASERAVQTRRMFYRVEAKEALMGWGTMRATWSPWRQKRPTVRARVIAPDGSVAVLDTAF